LEKRLKGVEEDGRGLKGEVGRLEGVVKKLEGEVKVEREKVEEKEGELDELLIVFGDLEEKVTKYKVSFCFGWGWGWWCAWANGDDRNDSRHWVRRCLMGKMMRRRMMMRTRRRKMKKKKRSRGLLQTQGLERKHVLALLRLGGSKGAMLLMCIFSGNRNLNRSKWMH
jgi:hypothetical protein